MASASLVSATETEFLTELTEFPKLRKEPMNKEDLQDAANTRLSDFKLDNKSLRIVAFVCGLIIFLTILIQAFCGGTINSLTTESGHYFLFDHNKYTEISLGTLLALAALTGVAIVAFFIGVISTICLVIRMRRESRQSRN
jgi:ABC-type multidrug transport system permease subunit